MGLLNILDWSDFLRPKSYKHWCIKWLLKKSVYIRLYSDFYLRLNGLCKTEVTFED